MSLKNYSSKQPSSQLLKQGEHIVKLLGYVECTSFDSLKGMQVIGVKDELPEWSNPIDVLAIHVGNKTGSIVYRLHQQGALRYSELSDKQLQSGKFVDVEGFACEKTKNKGLVRLEDEERTAVCERILDHFLWALGCPAGTNALDALDDALASGTEFKITVVAEPWEETEQMRITKYERLGDSAPKASASTLEA